MTASNIINAESFATVNGQGLTANTAGAYSLGRLPGRNMIINGDFQVWQRGTSFSVANTTVYSADRWQAVCVGVGSSTTMTRVAGATSGSFLGRAQRDVGNSQVFALGYNCSLTRDMCVGAAGNSITLSFLARAGADFSSTGSILKANIYTGTGNNDVSAFTTGFTGQVTLSSTSFIINNNLKNCKVTVNNLNANVTQLAIAVFYVPTGTAGAADYFDVTDVQLEISPTQTPFERKPFAEQLLQCNYFYYKTFTYATAPAQNLGAGLGEIIWAATRAGAATNVTPAFAYTVPMRTVPNVTLYNIAAANAQLRDIGANVDFSASTPLSNNSTSFFYCTATGNASTTIGNNCVFQLTADAELT